ncbi:hypothetical protein ACFRFL_37455 [Streptomyces sp. NPDC056708]|uniref:hypothetical protein n=1 Tax=unclassified Streptomyces TaxID=2593676 RepID=UPI0036C3E750
MDAELAVTIERLQRMRTDIELILRQAVPTDRPTDLPSCLGEAVASAASHRPSVR